MASSNHFFDIKIANILISAVCIIDSASPPLAEFKILTNAGTFWSANLSKQNSESIRSQLWTCVLTTNHRLRVVSLIHHRCMLYNILLIWIYDLIHKLSHCECFNAVHLPTALAFLAAGNVHKSNRCRPNFQLLSFEELLLRFLLDAKHVVLTFKLIYTSVVSKTWGLTFHTVSLIYWYCSGNFSAFTVRVATWYEFLQLTNTFLVLNYQTQFTKVLFHAAFQLPFTSHTRLTDLDFADDLTLLAELGIAKFTASSRHQFALKHGTDKQSLAQQLTAKPGKSSKKCKTTRRLSKMPNKFAIIWDYKTWPCVTAANYAVTFKSNVHVHIYCS